MWFLLRNFIALAGNDGCGRLICRDYTRYGSGSVLTSQPLEYSATHRYCISPMEVGMNDRTFQKFAGAAAFVVALTSLSYILVFLFLIPREQNPSTATGFTMARSLTSFAANPIGRQLANVLVVLGGLATAAAVVGIYQRLREKSASWAMWSLCLG